MLLLAAALFGVFFFCTLYLQQVLGYNALKSGVAFLPLTLTAIVASGLASRVVDRFTPKPVLVGGLLVATVGFALFTRLQVDGDYAGRVLPAMVVIGIGLGMSFVPITIAATSGVAAEDSGLASGLLNTTQQVGGSLGLAVLSAVSTSRITSALQRRIDAARGADARLHRRVHRVRDPVRRRRASWPSCCFPGAVASGRTSTSRPPRWPSPAAPARRTAATWRASPRGATVCVAGRSPVSGEDGSPGRGDR